MIDDKMKTLHGVIGVAPLIVLATISAMVYFDFLVEFIPLFGLVGVYYLSLIWFVYLVFHLNVRSKFTWVLSLLFVGGPVPFVFW